jgi:hypothetical protein
VAHTVQSQGGALSLEALLGMYAVCQPLNHRELMSSVLATIYGAPGGTRQRLSADVAHAPNLLWCSYLGVLYPRVVLISLGNV